MKILYKGITFDTFTLELKDDMVIDIDSRDAFMLVIDRVVEIDSVNVRKISTQDLKGAWGYICSECAKKHGLNTENMTEAIIGTICYVDDCSSFSDVYELFIDEEGIKDLVIQY